MSNYNLTKTQVSLYKLRHNTGHYWADITIDAGEKCGRISIASDFGSYQNYWGACGSSFKKFLIDLNIEYAADKFGADQWFDSKKTVSGYKQQIIQYRREDDITAEEARELWNECDELKEYFIKEEFCHNIWHCNKIMRFFDGTPDLFYDITPQFKRFWNEVWSEFIVILKAELEEEVIP